MRAPRARLLKAPVVTPVVVGVDAAVLAAQSSLARALRSKRRRSIGGVDRCTYDMRGMAAGAGPLALLPGEAFVSAVGAGESVGGEEG